MQAGFARLTKRLDTEARQLLGCSDLEFVTVGTRNFIVASGEADSGFSTYEIIADGSLVRTHDIGFDAGSGTQNIRDMTSFEAGGITYFVPMGRYDDNMAIYSLSDSGKFTLETSYSGVLTTYGNLVASTVVTIGGTQFFISASTTAGLNVFTINTDGMFSTPDYIPDSPLVALGDVSTLLSATLKGHSFVFAASSFDTGLAVFEATGAGLVLRDNITPGVVGFNAPSALAAVQINERGFLIMASAETDSILVFRVSEAGKLNLVDQMYDISETRFERPTSLNQFDYEGRHFLLAAGSDDGLTLFEIDYRGRLNVISVLADQFDTTLNNISDIEVTIIDDEIFVFVSSPTEHGFSEFLLSINTGTTIMGDAVKDVLVGTSGDDTIFGKGKSDVIDGGAGNDRLIDGRGRDILTGGTGADTFVFIQDGRRDKITDYELHTDRIDLSDFANLYSFHDLTITSRIDGAAIRFGEDLIWIKSMDGQPIDPTDWIQSDFLFG